MSRFHRAISDHRWTEAWGGKIAVMWMDKEPPVTVGLQSTFTRFTIEPDRWQLASRETQKSTIQVMHHFGAFLFFCVLDNFYYRAMF